MPDLDVTCSRCGSKLHHECHPETLQEAAIDLFMWRPESGFPKKLKGNGDGSEKDENVPFLTESFLYPLLGKEDARTLMALVRNLFYSMGIDGHGFQEKAWELIDQKKRDKIAEEKRRVEARKHYHQEMLPVETAPGPSKGLTLSTYRNFYCFDVNVRACEHGDCFEFWDPNKRGQVMSDRDKGVTEVTRTTEGELRATCKLCKRVHRATAAQVEGWKGEPRYQVTERSKEREPAMEPQDWIRSDHVRTVLGFKRR